MFGRRRYLCSFKNFAVRSFLLSFMAEDKNQPLLIMYEKYQISPCTTCLIRNSGTPIFSVIDLIGSLSIMSFNSHTNTGFFIITTIEARLLSCRVVIITIGFIQLFILTSTLKHSEIFVLELPTRKPRNRICRELNYPDQKIRQTLACDVRKHWTAVPTLLGLISSVYRDLLHGRSN